MKATDIPFNVSIMNVDKERVKYLLPVQSINIMSSSGQKLGPTDASNQGFFNWSGEGNISSNFHNEGLFSIPIFGRVGDTTRDEKFSYINIQTSIMHPLIYRALGKLKGLYHEIMSSKTYASWDKELKDFVISNEVDGDTGYQFFIKHWKDIKFKKTSSRLRDDKISLIKKYRDVTMCDKILVLPAGLRDVRIGNGGNLEYDPINEPYRRIVGISKTISKESINSPTLNYSRYQLQLSFNELYNTLKEIISGKSGFIQSKWTKRVVFNGTRNVISSMNTSKIELGAPGAPKATDTIMGLFQLTRGILPITIHLLRNGYLNEVFSMNDTSLEANLINTKTLKKESVEIPSLIKDKWATFDGLNKIINSYGDTKNRHKPIMIEGHYLGLIYKGPDNTFRIFGSIDELPESLDKDFVEPLTLVELIYLSGYREWNKNKAVITRYPVTELGSTYPTDVYVRTTVVSEKRMELGQDWEPLGDGYIANEFPFKDPDSFVDSLQVSPTRINGLNGDYDGDVCSALLVYSDDAIAEIEKTLHSREAYVDASGGLRTSVKIQTLSLVLRNMSGNYPSS